MCLISGVHYNNLADGTTRTVRDLGSCSNNCPRARPKISGQRISYTGQDGSINVLNLANETNQQIAPAATCNGSRWNNGTTDIDGSIVVWMDMRECASSNIYGYDLTQNTEFLIAANTVEQGSPAISGQLVAYVDARYGGEDVFVKDLDTREEIRVTSSSQPFYNSPPDWPLASSGNTIVFADHRSGNWDITGVRLEKIKYSVSGKVTDALGKPIPSAIITADGVQSTTTGSDGAYTLGGLSFGQHTLKASKVDPTTNKPYAFFPETITLSLPPNGQKQNFVNAVPLAWPFDSTSGQWTIVQGYRGKTSHDRGYNISAFDLAKCKPKKVNLTNWICDLKSGWARTTGTLIYAPADGKVGGIVLDCAGFLMDVDGVPGYRIALFHLDGYPTKIGQPIKRGDPIGKVSDRACKGSGGDHLHIGIYYQPTLPNDLPDTRKPVPFTKGWEIGGCDYKDDGKTKNQYKGVLVPCREVFGE